jgi:UDP-N-acetylmuramate dehydrogenase
VPAPLSTMTTLRLGGPPRALVEAENEADLIAAVRELDRRGEPILLIAGGSNVVVADEGFDGTAVHIATRGVERRDRTLTVQAGELWDDVVALTVADGLAGLECLSGIPGSTGATPIQNVGAYGQEVSETVTSVRVLDRHSGAIEELAPESCGFSYRSSAFKHRERHVVLSVTFALERAGVSAPVRYAELGRALGVDLGETAPLGDVRDAVLQLRRAKGMVIDRLDADSVSAGSFFTNPILDIADFEALSARAAAGPPAWPEPDGRVKTSAAWLIEHAGFSRGHGDGRVGISTKHTLALVNRGGGTTEELVELARGIAAAVHERFGVTLQPEPVFVGHSW